MSLQINSVASLVDEGERAPDAANATGADTSPSSLIAGLLREQQELTAVERFASLHGNGDVPAQAKRYSALLPMTRPVEGQQYAFEVDLDRCSGCKACVTACHSLNGLDESETWRDVGLLHGGSDDLPVLQHVTTACHHCLQPACLTACPVDAYEKDPMTGIVKHLDDQCFGCQYCTLACPYDVPKYNKRLGIVRKCDLCSGRLAVGEAPACVQACPSEAIAIKLVDTQQIEADCETNQFLPGAPEPQLTLPTTTYKTKRVFPRNMLPADYYSVHLEQAHWPLVIMLVLTQLSVGAFCVELVSKQFLAGELISALRPVHSLSALVFGLLALAASVFHLGRPQFAFRAVIGLKHSWLSREILAFGIFALLALLYASANWFGWGTTGFDQTCQSILGWGVGVAGLTGIVCSVMIYVFTRRSYWSGARTTVRFVSTALLLGLAAAWLTLLLVSLGPGGEAARTVVRQHGPVLCRTLMGVAVVKLLFEASVFRHLRSRQNTPLRRSAVLLVGTLSSPVLARFSLGCLGGVCMPGFLLLEHSVEADSFDSQVYLTITVAMMFVACLVAEILERYLFFTACVAPRMPGELP
jgi:Fe-S-cluster-containing dehydrogenase component/DMSO reductase anchor subunit